MLDFVLFGFAGYVIHRCVLFASHIHVPEWFPKWRKLALSLGVSMIGGGSLLAAMYQHETGAVVLVLGLFLYFISDARECHSYRRVRK